MKRNIILILFGVIVASFLSVDSIIGNSLEERLEELFSAEVELDDVDFSIFSGKLEIETLKIKNPEGFSEANLLEINDISAELDTYSLISQPINITNLTIGNAKVLYERNNNKASFDALLQSIKKQKSRTGVIINAANIPAVRLNLNLVLMSESASKSFKVSNHALIKKDDFGRAVSDRVLVGNAIAYLNGEVKYHKLVQQVQPDLDKKLNNPAADHQGELNTSNQAMKSKVLRDYKQKATK